MVNRNNILTIARARVILGIIIGLALGLFVAPYVFKFVNLKRPGPHYDPAFFYLVEGLTRSAYKGDFVNTPTLWQEYYGKKPYANDFMLYQTAGDIYANLGDF